MEILFHNYEEWAEATSAWARIGRKWEAYFRGDAIKKGEHGALIFSGSQVFYAPALPLEEVFDPTGAGDTFAGGFAGFLAASKNISFDNMKNAVIYGSALASFCVEKFGTQRMENLTNTEVNERLSQFKSLTQFDIELTQ